MKFISMMLFLKNFIYNSTGGYSVLESSNALHYISSLVLTI